MGDGDNAPTAAVARAEESKYFDSIGENPIWRSVSSYRDRMGIDNLTSKVSEVLCAQNRKRSEPISSSAFSSSHSLIAIVPSLPVIKAVLSASLKETQDSLSRLPKAPHGDPAGFVLNCITAFAQATREELAGRADRGKEGFAQRRNVIWSQFTVDIRSVDALFRSHHRRSKAFRDSGRLRPASGPSRPKSSSRCKMKKTRRPSFENLIFSWIGSLPLRRQASRCASSFQEISVVTSLRSRHPTARSPISMNLTEVEVLIEGASS